MKLGGLECLNNLMSGTISVAAENASGTVDDTNRVGAITIVIAVKPIVPHFKRRLFTCSIGVEAEFQKILASCSLKNSENPRRVPINDVPIARSEKASTMYETPLHLTLKQEFQVIGLPRKQFNRVNNLVSAGREGNGIPNKK
ncbi:hypothetical protein PanWU01x14_347180, partial [Parasponia andersonii]